MKITVIRKILMSALLSASVLLSVPVEAATIADKVEMLGVMDSLKVNTIRVVRREGFLNVQAEILNISNNPQQLYYRFKWLDDAGFTVGTEEGWKPEIVYGNQKKLIQTIAPVEAATDFRLEMNSPENSGGNTSPAPQSY